MALQDVDDISAAHEIIRAALSEGRKLVVVTRTEIEGLRTEHRTACGISLAKALRASGIRNALSVNGWKSA